MQQSPSVQLNTRIDGTLKEAGDKVFALLGYTPSQAIRALWEYAVAHRDRPEEVRAVLEGSLSGMTANEAVNAKLATLAAGRSVCAQLGPLLASIACASYEDLRADAYAERYAASL